MKYAALVLVVLLLLFASIGFPGGLAAQDAAFTTDSVLIDAFGLAAGQGWVLSGGRLYLTALPGAAWRDVTPPLPEGAEPAAAAFVRDRGWVVTALANAVTVWRTLDAGATWSAVGVSLYAPDAPAPPLAGWHVQFVDAATGWLVAEHVTSANFSRGDLFATTDGGLTWERRSLPLGEPVHFQDARAGCVAGGPTGDAAYCTTDGGVTWQEGAASVSGVAAADDIRWEGSAAGAGAVGWRRERRGVCEGEGAARICRLSDRLWATSDGGQTWTRVALPPAPDRAPGAPEPTPAVVYDPDVLEDIQRTHTELVQGHGFDKCEVAGLGQLADWMNSSPYRFVNLYIGGSSRACANSALTAAYIRQVQNQGWRFIPTWVGKQAPCFATSRAKISLDPETAFVQGLEEANWASDRLWALGLTDEEGAGGVVYYDMEYYSYNDAACHTAVKHFMTGWSAQMRARGNVAGVYSTGTIINGFAHIQAPPDVIWPANWLQPYAFRPDASVWNVYGLANTLWANQQRIRQYTGGHNEQWGVTTLNIDSNVLDGVVARMGPAPTTTPTATPTVTPTSTATRPPYTPVSREHLPLIWR